MKNPFPLLPVWFDRSLALGNFTKLLVTTLLILAVPALFFVSYDFWEGLFSVESSTNESLLMNLYESYLNPNFGDNCLSPERGIRLFVAYLGAFLLTGLLISLFVAYLQSRRERWEKGDLHYPITMRYGHYVIVIGGNEMVPDLISQLLENNISDFIVVMTNRDVPTLRKKLASKLGKDEKRIIIYYGERTSKDDLKHLGVQFAKEIYVIGEQLDIDQSGSHHDVKNMECVKMMSQLLHEKKDYLSSIKSSGHPILCRVMFEYQSSFSVFQFTDVDSNISSVLDFKPFNYYETWAQNVLVCPMLKVDAEKKQYLPLEGCTPITKDSNDTVHLIVVGMSRMGVAMAIEAAHLAHYPNFIYNKTENLRTRITFIDSVAKKEMQYIQGHYKELFALSRWRYVEAGNDNIYYDGSGHISYYVNDSSWLNPLIDSDSHSPYRDKDDYSLGEKVVDVDWEFIQGDLEMPTIQCYIRDAAMQKNVRLTIAICFPKDNASFAASLYLPDEVYEDNNNVIQVLAYQPYGDAMCQCFKNRVEMRGATPSNQRNNFNQFAKLKAFGMMDSCYNINYQRKMELAADQIWNQYEKTYSGRIGGRNDLRKALGKAIPLRAGKSLAACQWSNSYAAAHLWTKLRSINWDGKSDINEETKGILARLEHIRWNMEQLLLGYAPLRPDEQISMKLRFEQACKIEIPHDELLQITTLGKETINKNKYPQLDKWLDAWEKYDEEREILKANMSHIDLCSFEILNKLDKEAVKYDEDLTSILPLIYSSTIEIHD